MVVEGVNLILLHYKAVFSTVIEKINDNDLILLKENSKFRKTVLELNDRYHINCEVLIR
jgi:hypothetical protein